LHSTVVCLLWQLSLTLFYRETVGQQQQQQQQQLVRVVCGSQRRRMLFEEICNYSADIAIIAVLVTTFANTRKTKPKKKKKVATDKTTERKASQKQTEKSKNGNNPNSFSQLFAQSENVKRELHRLRLLRLVSVRPDESGCFDWRSFAKNDSKISPENCCKKQPEI
jgi:hypothetical protein